MKHMQLFWGALAILFISPITEAQTPFWQAAGGPCNNRTRTITIFSDNQIILSNYSTGLCLSTDGGSSWMHSSFVAGASCFVKDSLDVLYAAAYGLFRSTDRGQTWSRIDISQVQNPSISSMVIDKRMNLFVSIQNSGIFRSSDGGFSWTQVNSGLTDSVIVLLSAHSNGTHLFAATKTKGLFVTTDNGDHWKSCGFSGKEIHAISEHPGGEFSVWCSSSVYIEASFGSGVWTEQALPSSLRNIVCAPNGAVYARQQQQKILRSKNLAASWDTLQLPSQIPTALAVDAGSRVYAALDNGIFRSADEGAMWKQIPVGNTMIGSLLVTRNNALIAGGFGVSGIYTYGDAGIFRSTDKGISWTQASEVYGYIDAMVSDHAGRLYAAARPSGCVIVGLLYRSDDDGKTWKLLCEGDQIIGMAVNSRDEIFLHLGSGVIVRSTDNGLTWGDSVRFDTYRCFASGMAIASNDYLYTIVNDGKLMRSTDTGRTWIPLDSASTYQASTVFAGRNDVILVGRIGGTSRSTDYGNTWLISNFCSTRIVSLTQNSHGTFFACTDSGKVFQSTDIGTTWSEVSNGLFRGLTHAIACDSTGYLYVGTEGGGVYRTSISTPVDFDKSAEPQQFILFQNYPNPFNGLTNIEIKVKVETKVELNVYDVLGRVIIAIVHDRMSAGNHRFRWNAEKLPSGVYMYRVNIGGISETRRMVLLR